MCKPVRVEQTAPLSASWILMSSLYIAVERRRKIHHVKDFHVHEAVKHFVVLSNHFTRLFSSFFFFSNLRKEKRRIIKVFLLLLPFYNEFHSPKARQSSAIRLVNGNNESFFFSLSTRVSYFSAVYFARTMRE